MPDNTSQTFSVATDAIAASGDRLRSVDESVRRSIAERPLLYVAGAFALGCLIGRVVSRL